MDGNATQHKQHKFELECWYIYIDVITDAKDLRYSVDS